MLLVACGSELLCTLAEGATPRQFDITTYGAQPGGEALCTTALQKAVTAAAAVPPAEVVVPAGKFLTGKIR